MAAFDEFEALNKAFSGLGVDENALISILGKLNLQERQNFRKGSTDFFIEDERQFEKWDDRHVMQLRHEFLRLKDAIVLWSMHPWERDARLLKESLHKGGPQFLNVVIEIACTRSSQELLGARKAYHSLFNHSIEEDISFHVHSSERKLLVAVLSSYRYEGPKVNEGIAKSEANTFFNAIIKGKKDVDVNVNVNVIEEEEIVRILSTRSKLHLKAVYKHYKEISGNYLDEDLLDGGDLLVKVTVQCLCTPQAYFSEVLDASLGYDADEISKEGVSRVIVTRADVDMQQINEECLKKYGLNLSKKIEDVANGNYRDFLLTLLAKGD